MEAGSLSGNASPLIYCLLQPLGEGMWTAWDRAAQRTVVFQWLAAEVDQPLDRSSREALAVESISHPGMCRVFDVADHCGRTFVVREHVEEGRSLRSHAAERRLTAAEIYELGLEITAAVEAMHSTVMLHRHISAATAFLNSLGRPKVAGFVFAPAAGQERDLASTAPEIAAGQPGDARSDLFSLGALFFEMAAGRAPAAGEAAQLAALRSDLPPAFHALVRLLSEPDPGARFQSAEGVMRALTILRRGSGTPEVMLRLRNLESTRKRRHRIRRSDERSRKRVRRMKIAGGLAAALAVAALVWYFLPRYQLYDRAVTTEVSVTGNVTDVAVSPDGSTLIEVHLDDNAYSLYRRSASGGMPTQMLPGIAEPLRDLAFSHDGKALYFVEGPRDNGVLYRMALDGGAPQRLVSQIVTAAVAPDGKRAAYIRRSQRDVAVILGRVDGSNERVLQSQAADAVPDSLAWHPNNRTLAVAKFGEGVGAHVFTIDTESGAAEQLGWHLWHGRVSMTWLPDGNGLIVAGPEPGGAAPLWRVAYPDGAVKRITAGPRTFSHPTLSSDGREMAAVETKIQSRIWLLPHGDSAAARPLTQGDQPDGVGGMSWTPDNRIVFPTAEGDRRGLWVIDADGQRQPLIDSPDFASTPAVSPDGRSIVFLWYSGGSPKLWAIDIDGKHLRPVTRGGGEFLPSFGPDTKMLYFVSAVPDQTGVWRMEFENGAPQQVTRNRAVFASVSPDGKLLAYRTDPPDGSAEIVITSSDGAKIAGRFPIREFTNFGWSHESDAILWPRTESGAGNLWSQAVAGGAARKLTNFTADEMFSFAWSRDYSTLAAARGKIVSNLVVLRDDR